MNRNKYYINMGTQEISLNHDANNDDFVVYATEEEIIKLREIFDEVYNSDMRSFFGRTFLPCLPPRSGQ